MTDLAGLLMVQLVISALDAGQGKATTGARGERSEIMSYLELVGTACGQHRTQSGVPGSGVDG